MKRKDGIYLQDLKAGDVLEIQTSEYPYLLKVLDPKNCSVELSSNYGAFVKPAVYCLTGSYVRDGGYLPIEPGWISIGCRPVFTSALVLSYAQKISLNGKVIFPKE